MPAIDIVIDYKASRSIRCRQLDAMFDVPSREDWRLEWKGDLPIENEDWNVGLIVGPSGSGKSTIGKQVFGESYHTGLDWREKSVLDDFADGLSIGDISDACSAVGFNTIPAWMRPYEVLSTGEKFRLDVARRMLELPDPIVVDEFTSVVDRQVAKAGSWAIQKYVRKKNRKFVAITCHYDVMDWLLPDWVLDVTEMKYYPRGSLQHGYKRPPIHAQIRKVPYDTWKIFAPYHYLTAEMNRACQCFAMFIDEKPVAFISVLHYPNPNVKNIKRISRAVTLPDWQGLGLIFVLNGTICSAYSALGYRIRTYPAHPALIRATLKNPERKLIHMPKMVQKTKPGVVAKHNPDHVNRPCAVFEYIGPKMDVAQARQLVG